MSELKPRSSKTAYKHTGYPPAHCHGPQTRPRASLRSQLHHQYAAKILHHRCLCSGVARRPYSARLPQPRRGGKAPHRACSVPTPQISRIRAP